MNNGKIVLWKRDMLFEDTRLPWVLPSPNIPYKDSAIHYASSGICGELYGFLNIGVGYTLPFQTFAAPWMDAVRLKNQLDSYDIPGVAFRTIWYKPLSGSLKGQLVQGVQYFFTDYEAARITEIQFHVMQAVAEIYPDKRAFEVISGYGLFDKVCGTDFIRTEISKRYLFDDIKEYWRKDEAEFRALSQKYHLY